MYVYMYVCMYVCMYACDLFISHGVGAFDHLEWTCRGNLNGFLAQGGEI